jgi:glycosyltransferase involved in cell wall biosynthesis
VKNLKDLRIGYTPYSSDQKAPGDRRRFCWYADKRDMRFEIPTPSEEYDLIVLNVSCDLSVWKKYQGKAKIVFELIDSYLDISRTDIKGLLRGGAKFAFRQHRYLCLNYWETLQKMCQKADAVICSTEEQRQKILSFCDNVHIILDIQSSVTRKVKTDYSMGNTCNIVWEGLPQTVHFLAEIKDALEVLSQRYNIALHIITDMEYYKYFNKFGKGKTSDITSKIFKNTYLYEWNEELHSHISSACDIAIIPIPLGDPMATGKPENKLLLFWRMGIPTITSATPSYSRAMANAGLSMICKTQQDWQQVLERYIEDKSLRESAGIKGKAFALEHNDEEKTLEQWDKLLESLNL